MTDIQNAVWENSKTGDGHCEGCRNAGGKFNHPGFFNTDADILVVEESPSKNHFNFSGYDRSQDYSWYEHFFEEKHIASVATWPPVELFLAPIFDGFGYCREEIFELCYMTSGVKCPTNALEASIKHCEAYLQREIEQYAPSIVITAGAKATDWTAEILGVSSDQREEVSISRSRWWGLSEFDTDPPMIHAPHWSYYDIYSQLTDDEWEQVIKDVQSGLESLGFQ